MNKAEFKAIQTIAKKLNWQSVNFATIKKMVKNQQALELDCYGECDDEEDTLLSIALWDKDKIISAMYVSSYVDLVMWGVECFCDDMGITGENLSAMLTWNSVKDGILAAEYDFEQMAMEEALYDDYSAEIMRDVIEMNKYC